MGKRIAPAVVDLGAFLEVLRSAAETPPAVRPKLYLKPLPLAIWRVLLHVPNPRLYQA